MKTNLEGIGNKTFNLPGQPKVSGQITTDAQGNANMQPLFGYGTDQNAIDKNNIFQGWNNVLGK